MLGFHRVWASPDRVMWSRGYDHFVMRQAKDGVSYGPGALWLAVSAESRAQVDQVYADSAAAVAGLRLSAAGCQYIADRLSHLLRRHRHVDAAPLAPGAVARRGETVGNLRLAHYNTDAYASGGLRRWR